MSTIPSPSGPPTALDRTTLDGVAQATTDPTGVLDHQLNRKAIDMTWLKTCLVLAFTCYKGGVGKTTFTCMFGAFLAAMGFKVLVIDLNKQGNSAEDYGLPMTGEDDDKNPIFADGGEALAESIALGKPLQPIPVPGRENLFICPGGYKLKKLLRHIVSVGENEAPTVLARSLQPIAADYNYVLIDVPPENDEMTEVAAATSNFMWIPLRTDDASLRGFNTVAGIYRRMRREYNPYLRVLGAAIFATTFKEGSENVDEIHDILRERLGDVGTVYPHIIPYVEGVAKLGRRLGLTVTELEKLYITEKRSKRELDPVANLSAACIRMSIFMKAEIDARLVGHPAGAVERVDMVKDPNDEKVVIDYQVVYRAQAATGEPAAV